ncbi:MAG: NUDIX hydrolase [Candidatus Micrarchaeia archaeon]
MPSLERLDYAKKCIVAGCIISKDGKVLLIKHKKLGVWLYPGGHVEPNEHPHEAAVREAFEETGLHVRLFSCSKLNIKTKEAISLPLPFAAMLENVPYKTGAHLHFDLVYAAKPESGKVSFSKSEATGIRWFSKEELSSIDTFENVKQILLAFFDACIEKKKKV